MPRPIDRPGISECYAASADIRSIYYVTSPPALVLISIAISQTDINQPSPKLLQGSITWM